MISNNPNFSFTKFFQDILSLDIIRRDSYKDTDPSNENKGLFERYMMLFGDYIDSDMAESIDNYLNIIDAQICDEQFLNHISDDLGNPPDIFLNVDQYRNLLSYIVTIYKVKGTKKGYALFFGILGYDIIIDEIEPITDISNYDNEANYDRSGELDVYDQDICQPCSFYTITFFDRDGGEGVFDAETLSLLRIAIAFNEPINAKLRKLKMVVKIKDSMSLGITDNGVEINTERVNFYDSGNEYDTEDDPTPPSCSVEVDNIIVEVSDSPINPALPFHVTWDNIGTPMGFEIEISLDGGDNWTSPDQSTNDGFSDYGYPAFDGELFPHLIRIRAICSLDNPGEWYEASWGTSEINYDVTMHYGNPSNSNVTDEASFLAWLQINNVDASVSLFSMVGDRIQARVENLRVFQPTFLQDVVLLPDSILSYIMYAPAMTSLSIIPPNVTYLNCEGNTSFSDIGPLPPTITDFLCNFCNLTTAKLDGLVDQYLTGTLPKNIWRSQSQLTGDQPSALKQAALLANTNSVIV